MVIQPRRFPGINHAQVQCWECGTWVLLNDAESPCMALDGQDMTIMTAFPGQEMFMARPMFCNRECLREKLADIKLDADAKAVERGLRKGGDSLVDWVGADAEYRKRRP